MNIARFAAFIGRRVQLWYGVGVIACLGMAYADSLTADFLQTFLKSIGLGESSSAGPSGGHPMLIQTCAMLVGLGLIRGFFQFLSSQSVAASYEGINARLRLLAGYDLTGSPQEKFVTTALLGVRVSEIFPKASTFCSVLAGCLGNLFQCAGIGIVMLTFAWKESLLGLCGLFFIGLVVLAMNRKVRVQARGMPREQRILLDGIARVARNWLLVQVLNTNDFELDRMVDSTLGYSSHSIRASMWGKLAAVLPSFFGLVILVVLISVSQMVWHTPGVELVAFLFLFIRFVQTFSTLVGNAGDASATYPQLRLALDYFCSYPSSVVSEVVNPIDKISFMGGGYTTPAKMEKQEVMNLVGCPTIVCRNVAFTYPDQTVPTIHDFNLQIEAGEHVGIVGQSGAGKSTVISLLLGLIEAHSGSVVIGGEEPHKYFAGSRHTVGYVGAEAFLIKGTLRENIQYATGRSFSDSACLSALALADLGEFVASCPGQLDYKIDENGDGLSAGQKQRLALARALLLSPNVLILDEASANLDDKAEFAIAETVGKLRGHCTAVIVSHRPGMLRKADRVIELATNTFSNRSAVQERKQLAHVNSRSEMASLATLGTDAAPT